jgi:hypothetical protein
MKIRTMVVKMLYVDGRTDRQTERQTDMTKLIVALRNFPNVRNIQFA